MRPPRVRGDRPDPQLHRLRLHDVQHDLGDQPVAVRAPRAPAPVLGPLQSHACRRSSTTGAFRMVDSSMSNLVTTDDGVTLASVEEAAADGARLVRERSLYATSANGFLTGYGSDAEPRRHRQPDGRHASSAASRRTSAPTGLKFRDYYYNWDAGHRYVLNLRENETYTRYYQRLGTTPDYWVGSERTSAPNPATARTRSSRRIASACAATAGGRSSPSLSAGRVVPAPSTARPTSPRPPDGLRPDLPPTSRPRSCTRSRRPTPSRRRPSTREFAQDRRGWPRRRSP